MTVDTPEGPVTFAGTLGADGASMQGTLTYHQGQLLPMQATRRKAGGA